MLWIAVSVVLVLATAAAWWLWRRPKAARRGPPSAADMLVANLINNANHEMRSLELGRWFLAQLSAQLRDGASCGDIEYDAIAARMPGATSVTRAEQVKHMRALMALACTGDRSPLDMLAQYQASALDPASGTLVAVFGYASASPVPLP